MLLLSLLSISLSLFCSQEIAPTHIFANHKVGKIKLHHKNDTFFVEQDGIEHQVKKHWMDPELRKISQKQLNAFLGNGYLTVNKLENGEFTLKAKVRGLGGGPLSGYVAYWTTKTLCYGAAAAAMMIGGSAIATGATAALGGSAAATVAAKIAVTAVGKTAITGTVLSTTPVAALGAGLASTAVTAEVATAATLTTVAGSGGCLTAAAATVEAASVGVGAFFAGIPFLP